MSSGGLTPGVGWEVNARQGLGGRLRARAKRRLWRWASSGSHRAARNSPRSSTAPRRCASFPPRGGASLPGAIRSANEAGWRPQAGATARTQPGRAASAKRRPCPGVLRRGRGEQRGGWLAKPLLQGQQVGPVARRQGRPDPLAAGLLTVMARRQAQAADPPAASRTAAGGPAVSAQGCGTWRSVAGRPGTGRWRRAGAGGRGLDHVPVVDAPGTAWSWGRINPRRVRTGESPFFAKPHGTPSRPRERKMGSTRPSPAPVITTPFSSVKSTPLALRRRFAGTSPPGPARAGSASSSPTSARSAGGHC
jgi:hypothetical protein